ncbi:uncharacterized protein LOC134241285 [Saccostrea cucullata]|uniref:uncharacterized protein LOC134241285 n=1 Tax=Saccostrea cuccullata TaxID=36930 RepID=UPI002ED2B967
MSEIFGDLAVDLLRKFLQWFWRSMISATENNPKVLKIKDVEQFFPRYARHLKAAERINRDLFLNTVRVPELVLSNDISRISESREYSKLLVAATCIEKDLRTLRNYVLLHFVGAEKTSLMVQKEIENIISLSPNALWRVIVLKKDMDIHTEDKCSLVLFDKTRECWECLTSALELHLIQKIQSSISEKDDENSQDWTLLLNRLHSCSVLKKKIKNIALLPPGLEDALQSNTSSIVRYGFIHNEFYVTVRNGHENKIRKEIQEILSHHSSAFKYTLHTETESDVSFYTCSAQGQKLFRSLEEHRKGRYGTLGCTALLNDESPIAFTCSHVCVEGTDVFIDSDGEIVKLGTCVHSTNSGQWLNIQSDLSIVKITGEEHELGFPIKKAMRDINDEERTASLLQPPKEIESLQKEHVYKKGASTVWTKGKIVGSQKFSPSWKEAILVQSLEENGAFALPGDSGAIVFREGRDALKDRIDIIAVVIGEMKIPDSDTISHLCGYFHDAILTIAEKYPEIEKISMVNPVGEDTILYRRKNSYCVLS